MRTPDERNGPGVRPPIPGVGIKVFFVVFPILRACWFLLDFITQMLGKNHHTRPSCVGVLAGPPYATIRDLQPGHPNRMVQLLLLLLLLLLFVETKAAAQHSCHMLQVRDFNGILLGIGSKVWRDVSSWTSCPCGTQVLVGLLLVFCCVVLGGGQKTTTGLQILFLGG